MGHERDWKNKFSYPSHVHEKVLMGVSLALSILLMWFVLRYVKLTLWKCNYDGSNVANTILTSLPLPLPVIVLPGDGHGYVQSEQLRQPYFSVWSL